MVGSIFDKSNFGVGISRGNDKTNTQLSLAILALREQGYISELYNEWWSVGSCPAADPNQDTHLELSDFTGAFAFLGLGLVISTILILIENIFYFLYNKKFLGPWWIHVHKFLGYTDEEIEKAIEEILMSPDKNPVAKSTIKYLTLPPASDHNDNTQKWITQRGRRKDSTELF